MVKKKVARGDLIKETERLLLEKGYEGVNFSVLSERLGVGRSTLYDHFSSKDELIAVYMTDVMDAILAQCDGLMEQEDALLQIKEMIRIFHTYSQIHKIVQLMPALCATGTASEKVTSALSTLQAGHHRLMNLVTTAIEKAKAQKRIRNELPTPLIASLVFHSILLPKTEGHPPEAWSELIFDLLFHGLQTQT
ncbi:TetR/AcrR family transcriptional regulator [Tumebacillus algifaecis]|uniref:TetR/AcrR family transcriptional regulator n=1 Tax=Tumebacillus algifaecis TaxID=1214604 RepID=UPI0012FE4496|nr:TetR/AcrR family transcriptional regulator [Tumebacillus algifaecis]